MAKNFSTTPQKHWLGLSEAARTLGVHPGTLRRWTDAGEIPCIRTPGGHRRFLKETIESFLHPKYETQADPVLPESLVSGLITQTRHEMMAQRMEVQEWYGAFTETGRHSHRDSGRVLLGLILQYALRRTGREPILEQAKQIGREYGYDALRRGLSLVDTLKAFFFFRETIIKTMRPGLSVQGKYDSDDVHIHRSLRLILDQVLFAAVDGYETLMLDSEKGEASA